MVLSFRKDKEFSDHLSIRNVDEEGGLGVFAERNFYKGAVVTLYVGQPVWASAVEGGGIPEATYVHEAVRASGIELDLSEDILVPIRDLRGRYYVVRNKRGISPSLQEPPVLKSTISGQDLRPKPAVHNKVRSEIDTASDEIALKPPPKAQSTATCPGKYLLHLGAHLMRVGNDNESNVVLAEDGSVVAKTTIQRHTELVLNYDGLMDLKQVKKEMELKKRDVDICETGTPRVTVRSLSLRCHLTFFISLPSTRSRRSSHSRRHEPRSSNEVKARVEGE